MTLNKQISDLIDSPSSESYSQLLDAFKSISRNKVSLKIAKVKSVKLSENQQEQYVYDIGMKNTENPWFFGNNILAHNSCYFTAYPALKKEIDSGDICWEPEDYIQIYNDIAVKVSETFPDFLKDKFNVPTDKSTGIIASNREIVAKSALFIKKKRYAALMVDKEGIRYDTDGKEGKVKVVGLDLRRSDTPKFMQEFLMELLTDTLKMKGEDYVIDKIREFKIKFSEMDPWKQGTPKTVNKISHYNDMLESALKAQLEGRHVPIRVPGHVQAGINWNYLRLIHGDKHSPKISNGTKSIVCKLIESSDNQFSSIAYPTDIVHLPTWFTDLPFDVAGMEQAVVDKKISNLLSVLKWDLSRTQPQSQHFESLFGF